MAKLPHHALLTHIFFHFHIKKQFPELLLTVLIIRYHRGIEYFVYFKCSYGYKFLLYDCFYAPAALDNIWVIKLNDIFIRDLLHLLIFNKPQEDSNGEHIGFDRRESR